jgi:hypothetical protein
MVRDEVRDACSEGFGFARARRCKHLENRGDTRDSTSLLFIEAMEDIHGVRSDTLEWFSSSIVLKCILQLARSMHQQHAISADCGKAVFPSTTEVQPRSQL